MYMKKMRTILPSNNNILCNREAYDVHEKEIHIYKDVNSFKI
jgi:hypothetical protein